MLNIRLSRTGKTRQPSFRIVVQEHTAAVKGKFIEEIGYYRPATPSKDFKINSERAKYWLSVGAQPSDTMAVLLKKNNFEGMEKFIEPRDKKRKKKGSASANEVSASTTSPPDTNAVSVPTASPQPQVSPEPPETSATTAQPSPKLSETPEQPKS